MKLLLSTIFLLFTNISIVSALPKNNGSSLDSIITYNGHYVKQYKEVPIYGASGITKTDGFIWNDGQWVHSFVTNYTYDTKANLLSEIKTMKDGEYIGQKSIYTYDDQNNFLSEEFYISNSSTQLIGLSKHVYQYNPDWTIKNVTASVWDAKSAIWIEEALYKYEYDTNQNQTLEEISVKTIN
ncbi:MAG: hypothetical protein ACK5MK_13340, partial [Dysgonomonas sp.]